MTTLRNWAIMACVALLIFPVVFNIFHTSPVRSEDAHLANGVYYWCSGSPDFYRVNPPLVRATACIPVSLAAPRDNWEATTTCYLMRNEFALGTEFCEQNSERLASLFVMARLTCLLFVLLGGVACFRFSRCLFSKPSSILVVLLGALSPCCLGHAPLIMPDFHAAMMGVLAVYCYYMFLRRPSWGAAFFSGLSLGIAELSKFTMLVLYPVFLGISVLWCFFGRTPIGNLGPRKTASYLCLIFLTSLVVLNAAYLYDGTFASLQDFRFKSTIFSGCSSLQDTPLGGGNRFEDTLLGTFRYRCRRT